MHGSGVKEYNSVTSKAWALWVVESRAAVELIEAYQWNFIFVTRIEIL
jgi:hypothetical protein